MNLYLTADRLVKEGHGGGSVVYNESEALKTLGNYEIWERDSLVGGNDPWGWDLISLDKIKKLENIPKLCHIYSGTFSNSVQYLKENGCKVTITCAAHRIADSKKAHEELGISYNYTHLTDSKQWEKYSFGYKIADILVVPSSHSKKVVEEQGCENPIEIIPHGCILPKNTKLLPKQFVVGTLGAVEGPDKGLVYLLKAWKKLNYKDSLLMIAGNQSTSDYVQSLVRLYGGGNIYLAGWQNSISDFYNALKLYIQPSCTEGFGLEVLEAHAHARPSLCSDHAGAVDLVHDSCRFPASDVDALAEKINEAKNTWDLQARGSLVREQSFKFSWDKIKLRYINLWKGLLQ